MKPGRCHCRGRGGAEDPGEGLQRCLVGAGAAVSLIWGSGVFVPGWGRHLPTPSRYHQGVGAETVGRGLQNRPRSGMRTGRVGRR